MSATFQRLKKRVLASLGLLALASFVSCDARPRVASEDRSEVSAGEDRLVLFDLSAPLPETLSGGGFFPTPIHRTYAGVLGNVRKAEKNDKAKGFLVRLGTASHGFAQTAELGRAFQELRESKRPIYCHADVLDNAGLWLAAASCDKIWLSPAGSVESVGIAGQTLYFKGLLDRLKVKADYLHAGRFKSAAESLTRDGPSEEAEESIHFVLASLRGAWLDGIASSRTDPAARDAAEAGPWHPKAAQAIGLIDEVGYESDARAALKADTKVEGFVRADGANSEQQAASDIAQILRTLTGGSASFDEPHVAVLPAQGGISMSAEGAFEETGIAARSLTRVIRRLKKQPATKAVVLRIDSPGGSALASDLLWHELKELAKEKPLIVSVGSMAASGGYYLASAAHKIVAEHSSIVGSIGVVGGKFVLDEALAEYGVSTHTFAAKEPGDAGVRAAYMSPLVPWDETTRNRVQEQMDSVYALFLDRVAQGRPLTVEQVREVAEGRIWSGQQGLERKLVDELGGLRRALELARADAGLPEDAPVTVEGDVETLFDLLGLGEESDEADVHAAIRKHLAQTPSFWRELAPAQRRHLQSLLPLLRGEAVVAAVPFSLLIE